MITPVYILTNKSNKVLYIGVTDNIDERIKRIFGEISPDNSEIAFKHITVGFCVLKTDSVQPIYTEDCIIQ